MITASFYLYIKFKHDYNDQFSSSNGFKAFWPPDFANKE